MKDPCIEKSTFRFLTALKRNNNREWFLDHKSEYQKALENTAQWVDGLLLRMGKHDVLQTRNGKEALWRIYNDVRFSKDKTPYNPRFAGNLKRLKPHLRGGYYFWIRPGATRVGCGFTYPNKDDLKRIREDIAFNQDDWMRLLNNRSIKKTFGSMQGDTVATAPKGYSKVHPAIELLRFKQFWFERSFTDQEVLSADFMKKVDRTYQTIRPFFDYMTDVLTTDANGESLL